MDDERDDLDPTKRFTSRVEHYAKYRPGYPYEIVDLLSRTAGLTPGASLADIGSGTGILTEILLRNGHSVLAIEPNTEMRSEAERLLAQFPTFQSIDATAEATSLPTASVDGVLTAQAFHWFDGPRAASEFRRIAKAGGFIALIWNVRDPGTSQLMAEYERIVHEFGSNFARSGKEWVPFSRLRELFGPDMVELSIPNYQDLDEKGLQGRMLSASYMPQAGAAGYEGMMHALARAFERFQKNGCVRLEYETRVYVLQVK